MDTKKFLKNRRKQTNSNNNKLFRLIITLLTIGLGQRSQDCFNITVNASNRNKLENHVTAQNHIF